MSSQQNQKVQGGHLVKIYVGGQNVGYGRSSNIAQDYGTQPVHTLGTVAPREHVPMMWSGQITLDQFFLNRNAITDQETIQLFEMVAAGAAELADQVSFDITVLGQNDQEIMTYQQCTPTNFNISQQANQFTGQNCTFLALEIRRGPTTQFRGRVGGSLGTERDPTLV